jgi:hypothetical protein
VIPDLAVPLVIDRARATAAAQRARDRARRRSIVGATLTSLGIGVFSVAASALVIDPNINVVIGCSVVGLGPFFGGIFLLVSAIPSRWRSQAFTFAAHLSDARGGVSASDLAPLVGAPSFEVAAVLAEVVTAQRFGWSPPAPFGTCDPARYESFRSGRLARAIGFGAAAFPFLVMAFACWAFCLLALFQAEWLFFGILLLAGFGPGIPGFLLAARALGCIRDRARIGRLAIALLAPTISSMDEIVRATSLSASDARGLARAALEAHVFGPDVGYKLGLIQVSAPLAPMHTSLPAIVPAAPLAWPGRVLKRTWVVDGPLGAGGMGTVFRGRDMRDGHPVAIKIVSPDVRVDDDAFRRFHREAYALATLQHPAIVALRDYDRTEEGVLYLVMDHLAGETLETLLQRAGKLALEDAIAIASQIGGALAAAHGAGLLHRDVKPSNIFVSGAPGAPRATLIDFGLVKSVIPGGQSRVTTRGQVVGTPLYMSPEQARGDAVDARSDLYSLAVVAYEMITGVPPFFDPSIAVVYAKLLSGQVPSIKSARGELGPTPGTGAEDRLDAILQRALSPLAADRHPTVETFTTDLALIRANESDIRATA